MSVEKRDWRISQCCRKPTGYTGQKTIEDLTHINLGPWQFVVNECDESIKLSPDWYVFFTPPFPYFESSNQLTGYLVSATNNFSPITFIDVLPEIGEKYFQAIGEQVKKRADGNQPIVTFNISSYNHLLFLKYNSDYELIKNDPIRRLLAQSVPILHCQLLFLPPDFLKTLPNFDMEDLREEDEFFQLITKKLRLEMGFSDYSDFSLNKIKEALKLMREDSKALERWRRIISPAQITERYPVIRKCGWFNDETGNGLELLLPFSFNNSFFNNGSLLCNILNTIENLLSQSGQFLNHPSPVFPLPGYNFVATFEEEGGQLRLTLCPHDSIRCGPMEQRGIIIFRPGRESN